MVSQDEQKKLAGYKSVEYVEDGMTVGLGTGSTAKYAVEAIAENGLKITGVPTSIRTKEQAESLGIDVVDLNDVDKIDVTIDGADQFDVNTGNCVKGGGGAHYIEKQVAKKSDKLVVIVDESKVVQSLEGYEIPLEIDEDCKEEVQLVMQNFGYEFSYRDEKSDSGNLLGDVSYNGFMSVEEFENQLMSVRGVIDTGFFLGIADVLIVGKNDGAVEVVEF